MLNWVHEKMSDVVLSENIVSSLKVGRVFRDFSKPVNSCDFTPDGRYAVFASDDDVVAIYDCDNGAKTKMLGSKKYGVENINFFHSGIQSCVCSSRSPSDFSLRYWDLYENTYIRYFSGHVSQVTTVDVHPYEDVLLSGGLDRAAFLWDLRKENAIARIRGFSSILGSFDTQGLTFALSCADKKVFLFDWKKYDQGEFASYDVSQFSHDSRHTVSKLLYSPCGRYLVVSLEVKESPSEGRLVCLDAFSGQLIGLYSCEGLMPKSVSVSPDSQFLVAGTSSGSIAVWKVALERIGDSALYSMRKLEYPLETPHLFLNGHTSAVSQVAFNPVRCMLASASTSVAFWLTQFS